MIYKDWLNNLFIYTFNYYIILNERIILFLNKYILMNNNHLNRFHDYI